MKKLIFIGALFLGLVQAMQAQQTDYARQILDTLCSAHYHGRGYVRGGDSLAAQFIKKQLQAQQAQAFEPGYFQYFSIPANTFPDTVLLSLDNQKYKVGHDYIISGDSPSVKGKFALFVLDSLLLKENMRLKDVLPRDLSQTFIVFDQKQLTTKHQNELRFLLDFNFVRAAGYIELKEDLVYVPQILQKNFPVVFFKKTVFQPADSISIHINANYIQQYQTQNVVAFHPGQVDTFIVFSAHYDHLGRLGTDAYFPGAHDNASGVALCLDLARYYAQQKPYYGIAYLFFSAEEVGLFGSNVYTENPFFDLRKIKVLFNLDLVATGSAGITLVNATVYPHYYNLIQTINAREKLLSDIKKRAPAANSDHYFFYEKGVPSFFIYTLGNEYRHYHNIYDRAQDVPLTAYSNLKQLLILFQQEIEKPLK